MTSPDARPVSAVGRQSGYALVEVLVAIALMGVVIAAISMSMLTLLFITRSTSQTQRMSTALTSYTESLKASPYVACTTVATVSHPTAAELTAAHAADPAAWRPNPALAVPHRVVAVEYWNPASGAIGAYQSACPATDGGRQRLTVEVVMAGQASRRASVVIAEPQIEPTP